MEAGFAKAGPAFLYTVHFGAGTAPGPRFLYYLLFSGILLRNLKKMEDFLDHRDRAGCRHPLKVNITKEKLHIFAG